MSQLARLDQDFAEMLDIFDRKALERVNRSYMWSTNTWGGHRCGGCGLEVRPCTQLDLDYSGPLMRGDQIVGHIDGHGYACHSDLFKDLGYQCPGEDLDWESNLFGVEMYPDDEPGILAAGALAGAGLISGDVA